MNLWKGAAENRRRLLAAQIQPADSPTSSAGLYAGIRLVAPDSIRVLDILPGEYPNQVHCTLRTVCLDERPDYEALSYTWGNTWYGRSPRINESYGLPITFNLNQALLRLRYTSRPRTLWVDAVCINQNDVEERSSQVAMMGRIYTDARCVNVWLGEHWESTSAVNLKPLVSPSILFTTALFGKRVMGSSLRNTPKAIDMALQSSETRWHDRAWIIQEFVLAREIYLYFDNRHEKYDESWLKAITPLQSAAAKTPQFDKFAKRVAYELEPLRQNMQRKRSLKQEDPTRKGIPFRQAVNAIRGASASDPKDMIYCVLGLLSQEEAQLIGSDYRLPLVKVYSKATFASIKTMQNFGIFAHVAIDEVPISGRQLPSWVVDFSNTKRTFSMADRPLGYGFQERLRKLNVPRPDVRLDEFGRILTFRGIQCDAIAEVMHLGSIKDPSGISEWEVLLSFIHRAASLARTNLDDPEGASHIDQGYSHPGGVSLLRRLRSEFSKSICSIHNRIPNSDSQDYMPPYYGKNEIGRQLPDALKFWNARMNPLSNGYSADNPKVKLSDLYHFREYACNVSVAASLFYTSSGLVGLAPHSVTSGDLIILVDSPCHFLVLHPFGSGLHRFCGLAYIHGLMTRDYWSEWGKEIGWGKATLQMQEFQVC